MENKWKNKSFIQSLKNAVAGIKEVVKEGRNIKIQFVFAILVSIVAFILKINEIETLILVLTIFMVFIAEFMNTAIEMLSDLYTTDYNEKIRKIKDISAGAVTLSAVASVIVGIIIFLPKLLEFI